LKKPVRYPEQVTNTIRAAMGRNGYRNQRQLAIDLRMEERALSRRFTGATPWDFQELHRLDQLLDFTDEEAILLIKGAKK
jgi:hypothetical protein